MNGSMGRERVGFFLIAFLVMAFLAGCEAARKLSWKTADKPTPVLEAMSVTWGANLKFEQDFLNSFGRSHGIRSQFVPNTRLAVYRQLLKAHTAEPDMMELDIVWASLLADGLVDLKPYLKPADKQAFGSHLLENYIVGGRIVALPAYVDIGVLYYRPDLLEKYGFSGPPATWGDLEKMAARIQEGERHSGNKDFWGYTWQGSATEGGTCNAMEWQASMGGGIFIEPNSRIHVRSPKFADALRRVTGWIGTISPPAEYVYREDESINLWDAGQVAFMRNWASGYSVANEKPGQDRHHFAVAPLPAGPGGHRGAGGGVGVAVSKYAANRELAVKALLELASEREDEQRLATTQGIPTHTALLERSDVKARTQMLAISSELIQTMVARPSLVAGEKYDLVSHEYAAAVNLVLRRKATPEAAMAELEERLVKITGFPVQPE